MKAVLMSIRPQWCELIASGQKTIEVRKTRPKMEPPFKCYIYCTKAKMPIRENGNVLMYEDDLALTNRWGQGRRVENPCGMLQEDEVLLNGKVIGEFVCDKIFDICIEMSRPDDLPGCPFPGSGLTDKEILQYLGNGKTGYGWHISDLKIYDRPRPLGAFRKKCVNELYCESCGMYSQYTGVCGNAALQLRRPPQSWCRVEELKDGK
jgi:predicted transcriptional regulator